MDVSENIFTPKSSKKYRVFHYKPSILGYPYFWKHPYIDIPKIFPFLGLDGQDHVRVGKMNMVDLAGSERQSKTGATGDTLKAGRWGDTGLGDDPKVSKALLTHG